MSKASPEGRMTATITVEASFGSDPAVAHRLSDAQFNAAYEDVTAARAIVKMILHGGTDELSAPTRGELFGGLYRLLDSAAQVLMTKHSGPAS